MESISAEGSSEQDRMTDFIDYPSLSIAKEAEILSIDLPQSPGLTENESS